MALRAIYHTINLHLYPFAVHPKLAGSGAANIDIAANQAGNYAFEGGRNRVGCIRDCRKVIYHVEDTLSRQIVDDKIKQYFRKHNIKQHISSQN